MNQLRFVLCALVALMFLVPSFASAQELPVDDPRNGAFLEYFQEIVAANPNIGDFNTMPPGSGYFLPDGSVEYLEDGDTQGIWGNVFESWYGYPYQQFLEGRDPEEEPQTAVASEAVVSTPVTTANVVESDESNIILWGWWGWAFVLALLALAAHWHFRDRTALGRERELEEELESMRREQARSPAERFTPQEVRTLALFPVLRTEDEPDGPPFIPGGIRSDADLGLALQRSAQLSDVLRHPDRMPQDHSTYRFNNGVRGLVINGKYRTYFADGTARERVVRRDTPSTHRVVWRAGRAESTTGDGETQFTYAEEVCANGMGLTIGEHQNIDWVPMPESEQRFTLPESATIEEPGPDPEPEITEEEPDPGFIYEAIFVTEEGGEVRVPIGSRLGFVSGRRIGVEIDAD